MRVLMLTQQVDPGHDLLGFVPGWIRALSARVDKLFVLAGRVVATSLPPNVEVASLGKETGAWRVTRVTRFFRGLREAIQEGRADVIFAHMNPEYVLAAAPVTRAPIVLWYTHPAVTRRLKLAAKLARRIVTAAPESIRLKSDRIRVTGHGIDLALFPTSPPPGGCRLLSVGRLDEIKGMDVVLRAAKALSAKYPGVAVTLVGEGKERASLEALARELGVPAVFAGRVPYREVAAHYRACDVFVSASRGALDKAILEAMASSRPAVSCADAFAAFAPAALAFRPGDATGCAAAVSRVLESDRSRAGAEARALIEREHSLEALMGRLVGVFEEALGKKG
jgi:glycosyltransferase involved in cell wall biosynthesis